MRRENADKAGKRRDYNEHDHHEHDHPDTMMTMMTMGKLRAAAPREGRLGAAVRAEVDRLDTVFPAGGNTERLAAWQDAVDGLAAWAAKPWKAGLWAAYAAKLDCLRAAVGLPPV